MSSGSLSGSAIPRFVVPATDRASFGPAAVAVAEALGWTPMPWQSLVITRGLEHEGGELAYRDVAVGTPRQSGKSALLLSVILYRLLSAPGQKVVYGAQTRLAAREKLFTTWWPRIARCPLRDSFRLKRATGAEGLSCANGSTLSLLSADDSSVHGESLDLVVLDECWSLTAAVEQAVRPTLATRINGQVWMTSTAGNDRSAWWRSKVDQGRAEAQLGASDGMAYFEWSAGDDVDVTDETTWASFMPALSITIDARVPAADLRSMPLGEWSRAYANRWPDESDTGWRVVAKDVWMAARL